MVPRNRKLKQTCVTASQGYTYTSEYLRFTLASTAVVIVKVLVRWAEGKRLTDRLPNLSLITLSPPGTDRILRVDAPPHAVPISGNPETFFRLLT